VSIDSTKDDSDFKSYLPSVSTHNEDFNLLLYIRILWLKKYLILGITLSFSIFSIVYSLSLDNMYKATVTLLPSFQQSSGSRLFGLTPIVKILTGEAIINNESFYSDVLKSEVILNKLLSKKWLISGAEQYLYEFLKLEKDESHHNPQAKLNHDIKTYLRDNVISFSSSEENGLMKLSVTFPLDPKLSSDVANWLTLQLHEYNESFFDIRSIQDLLNAKSQVDLIKLELIKAENKLSRFLNSNKNRLQSANLQLDYIRLQREIDTENLIYTQLRQRYEILKINSTKRTRTITVLDSAIIPIVKSGPSRGNICIMITLLGGFISILFVLIQEKLKGIII